MASEGAVAKRANLVASRVHWSHMDLPESVTARDQDSHGSASKDSVRKWLTTTVTEGDAKHESLRDAAVQRDEPLRRNPSNDDDLALGVEASLYGSQGVRTVQEFLRWTRSSPSLSRWNSISSATSGHSGPLSVMDILNLWNDDPEEVLLDLGFGCDEPDLSGRIPARFINYPSQARGINLQVFLEAQKNRLDLENPDVSNRFRQLEVLQQVTTAFSTLVGSSSSPLRTLQGKDLPPEARERRRCIGMLFRRASKKSLSQMRSHKTQDLPTPAEATPFESEQPSAILRDKKVPLKRLKHGHMESVCLSPLAEEQGTGPHPQPQSVMTALSAREGAPRPPPLRECHPLTTNMFLQRKRSPGQARESFEMEEIHSFDDSSVTGSCTGGAENLARGVIRTNSCQSDSSGFLEEPFIPSFSQQASPGSDLIKALSGLSGGSTDSQSSERPSSPFPSSPHTSPSLMFSSSLPSSGADKTLLSSPSQERSSVFDPSPSPDSSCVPKRDLQISEAETPQDQDQCPSASPSALSCNYPSPCFPSSGLQGITHFQSPALPSPASFTSHSPTSSLERLITESEEIRTADKDAPTPHLSTHDSEDTERSAISTVPPPASSPSPNLDRLSSASMSLSSTQHDSSSASSKTTQLDQAEVASRESSLTDSGGSSSVFPSSPHSSLSDPSDPHFLSSLASPPVTESLSWSPEHIEKDFPLPDSGAIGVSDPFTDTQKKEEETSSSLSFQFDEDNPLTLPSTILESSSSHNPTVPVSQSNLSSKLHDPDPAGRRSDMTEKSISLQDRPCSNDDNTDRPSPSPIQDVTQVKMDHLSLDTEDTLQRNGNREVEGGRHSDNLQTQEASVYISDTGSSAGRSEVSRLVSKEVCNQTETGPQVPSGSLHGELSSETKPEELKKACQMDINATESESPGCSFVLHDEAPEAHSRTEVKTTELIQVESLDLVFQTSVDGSESENGDVEAFFQQLETEGRAYWAEPIQISNPTPVPEESGSFEATDGSPMNSGPAALDSLSSTGPSLSLSSSAPMDTDQTSRSAAAPSDTSFTSPSSSPGLKPSNRSVSVQMSSSPSSHIAYRKDVPYMTDPKPTLHPTVLPLDTSTPFRAVQSWTDLHMQRNTPSKKLSHGALHNVPTNWTESMNVSKRPKLIYSSSPSLPLLSSGWQSHSGVPGLATNYRTMSVSLSKELWSDEEEEVDGNGNEDEKMLWEANQTATMSCCCSCDHQSTCCTHRSCNKQQTLGNIPYSLDELEEMMLCLQQFRSVLSNMEEQLCEDQAAVYSALSDQDRERVRDVEELRRAVKQEAGELEMQLNELAHHYDDSIKMKMHRLLDEQSLLCSQLRIFPPGAAPSSLSPAPNRTVATQCSLLPRIPLADLQRGQVSSYNSWNVDSPRQSPPGSETVCEGLGCSPTKAEKLDIVGFLQRLKESLRQSVNTDALE